MGRGLLASLVVTHLALTSTVRTGEPWLMPQLEHAQTHVFYLILFFR